jgi:phosphoserine phosphatase
LRKEFHVCQTVGTGIRAFTAVCEDREMTQNKPQTLSRQQLLDRVRTAQPRTAVFDFDGTLWPGDAGSGFMDWSIRTGLLSPAATEEILGRHALYHQGEVDEITICGEMTQIYRGLSERAVRESCAAYFREHVEPRFFPEMVALVHELQDAGVEVWAVSSTNNWMIEEGVRDLRIPAERVLAACVSVAEDIISNDLVDIPSDEGKAASLRRVGLTHPDVVFGNSIHDFAMLEMARVPFPINPTVALEEKAAELGWPVYYPAPR